MYKYLGFCLKFSSTLHTFPAFAIVKKPLENVIFLIVTFLSLDNNIVPFHPYSML